MLLLQQPSFSPPSLPSPAAPSPRSTQALLLLLLLLQACFPLPKPLTSTASNLHLLKQSTVVTHTCTQTRCCCCCCCCRPLPSPPPPSPSPAAPSPSPLPQLPAVRIFTNMSKGGCVTPNSCACICRVHVFLADTNTLLITPSTMITVQWTSSLPPTVVTWSPQYITGSTSARGIQQFTSGVMPRHTATKPSMCTATVLSGPPNGYALDVANSVMTVTGLADGR
jgi:hypothetical protein